MTQSSSNSQKYDLLQQLLTQLDEFSRYKTVALLLGGKPLASLAVIESAVKAKLNTIQKSADSLDMAAILITKDMKNYQRIFIYPATTRLSPEITQFAAVMKDKLSAMLHTVRTPKQSQYLMTGNYENTQNGIDLVYHLLDQQSNSLQSRSIHLTSKAYQGYQVKPQKLSFSQLLYQYKDIAISSDFKVSVITDKGDENLLY